MSGRKLDRIPPNRSHDEKIATGTSWTLRPAGCADLHRAIVDEGKSASLSTTTIDNGTYAFFFKQRGLMGGLGLQGSKITRIRPGR